MVIAIVLITAFVVGFGVYYTIKTEIKYTLPDVAEQTISTGVIFANVDDFLIVWIPILLLFVVLISLILLRKIAGPEMRLSQHLQALANGDFTFEAEIKKGEELANLVKLANKAKENLSGMINEEKEIVNRLLVATGNLLRELDSDTSESITKKKKDKKSELTKILLENLEQLQILTNRYKISKPIK